MREKEIFVNAMNNIIDTITTVNTDTMSTDERNQYVQALDAIIESTVKCAKAIQQFNIYYR